MKKVVILHQGIDRDDDPLVQNAVYLRNNLIETIGELGFDPKPVYLDDKYCWVDKITTICPYLVVNAADIGVGYDPTLESIVPEILDNSGICYTGSNKTSLDLSNNKPMIKDLLASCNIPVPQEFSLDRNVEFPVIIKYADSHNSEGIDSDSIAYDYDKLMEKIKK